MYQRINKSTHQDENDLYDDDIVKPKKKKRWQLEDDAYLRRRANRNTCRRRVFETKVWDFKVQVKYFIKVYAILSISWIFELVAVLKYMPTPMFFFNGVKFPPEEDLPYYEKVYKYSLLTCAVTGLGIMLMHVCKKHWYLKQLMDWLLIIIFSVAHLFMVGSGTAKAELREN